MPISELRMHHVGSALRPRKGKVYFRGDAMKQEWKLSGNPFTVTDGEWRKDQQDWVVPVCRDIALWAGMPEWVLQKWPGNKYLDFGPRKFYGKWYAKRIREHVREQIKNRNMLELPYVQWAVEGYRDYLEQLPAGSDTVYVVSLPTPFALLTFSGLTDDHLPMLEELMGDIAAAIFTHCPGVRIEWALPAEYALPAVKPMRRSKRQRAYKKLLESLGRVIRKTPRGSHHSAHRCYGDLNLRPVVPHSRQSASSQVDFANAFTGMPVWWEADGWILDSYHDPYCDGRHLPRLSWRLVRLIRKGQLHKFPSGAIYIPGVLHFAARSKRVARMLEKLIKLLADVGIVVGAAATPCGNGRMTHEQGTKVYQQLQLVNRELRRRGIVI